LIVHARAYRGRSPLAAHPTPAPMPSPTPSIAAELAELIQDVPWHDFLQFGGETLLLTALLAEWLKSDFDHLLLNLDIENTSLTVAEFKEKRVRLKTVNDASHLIGTKKYDNAHYH
jgi:hypothetical protein